MSLTLQLPNGLSEELEQQAERIGVSPEEHATELLSFAAVMAGEEATIRSGVSGYRYQLAETMLRKIRQLLNEEPRSEADDERLRQIETLLSRWLREGTSRSGRADDIGSSRPSALGKYAHIPGTSEDFARLKQAEIDREDGRAA